MSFISETLRKLTADYTEEEYREYLNEAVETQTPLPTLDLNLVSACLKPEEYKRFMHERYSDYIDAYLESNGIPKGQNNYTLPDVTGKESNKEIAGLLSNVAEETGYEETFLWEMFADVVRDMIDLGESFIEARKIAFRDVASISYEQDW